MQMRFLIRCATRRFGVMLVCLGMLLAAGLQSLVAQGAGVPLTADAVQGRADGTGREQADTNIYLPLTNYDSALVSPTATITPTLTVTPTVTVTPTTTVTPTATMTATASPTPSSTPSSTPEATPIVADLFVDDSNATGTEDGSVEHPYTNLQAAIDVVDSTAMTIAVAAGVYTEAVRIENKTVHLYGGFVGGSAADYTDGTGGDFIGRDPATTVSHLQGDRTDAVVTMIEAGMSTLDGFRITDGARSLFPEFGDRGGGVYVYGGAPTIAHNLIEDNDTRLPGEEGDEPLGGGIFGDGADLVILNNIIRNNIAGRGAGIAINGGAVLIQGNTVEGNRGFGPISDHGGGLYIASPQAEIRGNLIISNAIGLELGYGWGGGIIVFGEGSHALLTHNRITQNYAPSVGSGVFVDDGARATLDHELIYANRCPDGGTTGGVGIYVDGYEQTGSHVTIQHTTVAGHDCETQGGNGLYVEVNSQVTVTNSIFWGNGDDDFLVDGTSQMTVTYTLAGEAVAGAGNLSVDPRFADAAEHDYHLQSTTGRWDPAADGGNGAWVVDANHSPAIDAADPAAAFAAEPDPNGARANLGAYGNSAEASKSSP